MSTKIKKTTESAEDQLAEIQEAVTARVSSGLETVSEAIQEHPLLAVGIGIAVGYVLARILD